jgi:hypothetical protein
VIRIMVLTSAPVRHRPAGDSPGPEPGDSLTAQ